MTSVAFLQSFAQVQKHLVFDFVLFLLHASVQVVECKYVRDSDHKSKDRCHESKLNARRESGWISKTSSRYHR